MYTNKLFESYNQNLKESKKLEEKINKDNAEINKALANPNLGKNKDKIKAAGYEPNEYDGKVYSIKNPKTGKSINPSAYNKEGKQKVDFKGKLDSERPYQGKVNVYGTYAGKGRQIPNRAIIGKDKHGDAIANADDFDNYSAHTSMADNKPNYKSISKNINDYKNAVKDRDEQAARAKRDKEGLNYYEDKVKRAQDDLDREKKYIEKNEKGSKEAEARRKAIIDNIRKRKTESEQLNESVDFEDMLKELYNSYKQDGMEDNFWSDLMNCIDNLDYLNQWYSSLNESAKTKLKEEYSEKLGGDPEDFVSDVQSILDTLNTIDTSKFGSHLAEEIVEEFIETCNYQIEKGKRLASKDEFYTESEDIK